MERKSTCTHGGLSIARPQVIARKAIFMLNRHAPGCGQKKSVHCGREGDLCDVSKALVRVEGVAERATEPEARTAAAG